MTSLALGFADQGNLVALCQKILVTRKTGSQKDSYNLLAAETLSPGGGQTDAVKRHFLHYHPTVWLFLKFLALI
jgi:hypothetical protein